MDYINRSSLKFTVCLLLIFFVNCSSAELPSEIAEIAQESVLPPENAQAALPPDLNSDELEEIVPGDIESELYSSNTDTSFLKESLPFFDNAETDAMLEAESHGKYMKALKDLDACKSIPIKIVWKEFSPFFSYKWDDNFTKFAALFLTFWKRESLFSLPSKGVLIQPNCRKLAGSLTKTLPAKNIVKDLKLSAKKDRYFSKKYKKCNLKHADFGSLQWSYHWRISKKYYRDIIERAILMSSKYQKKEVKNLSTTALANLVKYNSWALFILGGLEVKRSSGDPQTAIRQYNTNPDYFKWATKNYDDFMAILQNNPNCSIQKSL